MHVLHLPEESRALGCHEGETKLISFPAPSVNRKYFMQKDLAFVNLQHQLKTQFLTCKPDGRLVGEYHSFVRYLLQKTPTIDSANPKATEYRGRIFC